MNLKGVVCALALVAASAGCSEDRPVSGAPGWGDDGRWWASDAGDAGDGRDPDDLGDGRDSGDSATSSGGADVVLPRMPDDMAALVVNVRRVLNASCAPCHSGREGVAEGGFGDIFDVEAMVAARIVVPGEPDASPLYTRTVDGEMPPGLVEAETNAGPRFEGGVPDPFSGELIGYVESEDTNHLRRWILRGAPPLRPTLHAPLKRCSRGLRTAYTARRDRPARDELGVLSPAIRHPREHPTILGGSFGSDLAATAAAEAGDRGGVRRTPNGHRLRRLCAHRGRR